MMENREDVLRKMYNAMKEDPTLIKEVMSICGSLLDEFFTESQKAHNDDLGTWLLYSTYQLAKPAMGNGAKKHKLHIIQKSVDVLTKLGLFKRDSCISVNETLDLLEKADKS